MGSGLDCAETIAVQDRIAEMALRTEINFIM
jgi:hypothetical protein